VHDRVQGRLVPAVGDRDREEPLGRRPFDLKEGAAVALDLDQLGDSVGRSGRDLDAEAAGTIGSSMTSP